MMSKRHLGAGIAGAVGHDHAAWAQHIRNELAVGGKIHFNDGVDAIFCGQGPGALTEVSRL